MVTAARRCFVDTNVLVYTFDDAEPAKQAVARALVEQLAREQRGVLSTQVLIELFNILLRRFKVSARTASIMTSAFCAWPVVDADAAMVLRAMARATQDQLSIWDSMVIEAALQSGALTLYTEDMQHARRFGSLTLHNPFV